MSKVNHNFKPVYDNNSKILILGTIPSVKSREEGFYYGHPRNRFWQIMADIFETNIPNTIKEKELFLLKNNIALWDVLKSCDIEGSSDNSIKNPIPNDVNNIIKKTNIKKIYTTGKKATELYNKYLYKKIKIECIYLPSTSPANQTISYDELKKEYNKILEYLKNSK